MLDHVHPQVRKRLVEVEVRSHAPIGPVLHEERLRIGREHILHERVELPVELGPTQHGDLGHAVVVGHHVHVGQDLVQHPLGEPVVAELQAGITLCEQAVTGHDVLAVQVLQVAIAIAVVVGDTPQVHPLVDAVPLLHHLQVRLGLPRGDPVVPDGDLGGPCRSAHGVFQPLDRHVVAVPLVAGGALVAVRGDLRVVRVAQADLVARSE